MAWKLVAKMCLMNPWCYALYLENHNYPASKLPLSNFLFLRFDSFVKWFCIAGDVQSENEYVMHLIAWGSFICVSDVNDTLPPDFFVKFFWLGWKSQKFSPKNFKGNFVTFLVLVGLGFS